MENAPSPGCPLLLLAALLFFLLQAILLYTKRDLRFLFFPSQDRSRDAAKLPPDFAQVRMILAHRQPSIEILLNQGAVRTTQRIRRYRRVIGSQAAQVLVDLLWGHALLHGIQDRRGLSDD